MGVRQKDIDQRVAGFVPGGVALLFIGHRQAAAFAAPADFIAGFLQLRHADGFFVHASGQQRRLVEKVGQLGAGITGCASRDDAQVRGRFQLHILGVNLENGLATSNVRQIDGDLAVETTRPQQCRIEHIRPVCGRDDDDPLLSVEAVHFHQQRVERLLAFVIAAAQAVSPAASDGVNFVDEHQTRCVLARLLEHVPHAAGANTDEHLHEIRAADAEEGCIRFAGDGLGQKSLARARRAHHQNAFGNAAAEFLKFLRVLQKLDQFGNFLFGFVHASHVFERGAVLLFAEHPRLALSEAESAFARHLKLADQEKPHQGPEQNEG